jgi:hypothetical protein
MRARERESEREREEEEERKVGREGENEGGREGASERASKGAGEKEYKEVKNMFGDVWCVCGLVLVCEAFSCMENGKRGERTG